MEMKVLLSPALSALLLRPHWINAVARFFDGLPSWVLLLGRLVLLVGVGNVIAAFVAGILSVRKVWKDSDVPGLSLGYLSGTGLYRRDLLYETTRRYAWDRSGTICSFSGLAWRLGGLGPESMLLRFLLSLVYLPLAALGMLEMLVRYVVGALVVYGIGTLHWLVLLGLGLLATLLIPVLRGADKAARAQQHCPHCYKSFRLPRFTCPDCGQEHDALIPGSTGLLHARCSCGRSLPVMAATGRSSLTASCPLCGQPLAASNARQTSLQLIGGNCSGKSSFLAAFSHQYLAAAAQDDSGSVEGRPADRFAELDRAYRTGATNPSPSDSVLSYTFVHTRQGRESHSLAIYDTPDEIMLSGSAELDPLSLGYSDGFLLLIDPMGVADIRAKCLEALPALARSGERYDDPEQIIEGAIQFFTRISGRATRKMSNVPVAVIVNKTDLYGVREALGPDAIRAAFDEDPGRYNDDIALAENDLCRAFLEENGLGNALNNLESVFANVRYFSTSARGRRIGAFSPRGVVAPVLWVAGRGSGPIAQTLRQAKALEDAGPQQSR